MPSKLNLLHYSACSELMFPPACAADLSLACSIGGDWRKQDSRCCVRCCCPSPYWITELIAMNWADQIEQVKSSATENGLFRNAIRYVSCWRCRASNAQARFRRSPASASRFKRELRQHLPRPRRNLPSFKIENCARLAVSGFAHRVASLRPRIWSLSGITDIEQAAPIKVDL
jgi:hypothetical protein